VRRSKTDQTGAGRKIGIPHGRGRWCPVAALEQWLAVSGISEGALFRPIDRHHRIAPSRLSGEAVCSVVRERVRAIGIDPGNYSGHSLRAGLATSAALNCSCHSLPTEGGRDDILNVLDHNAVTGHSLPVRPHVEVVAADAPLGIGR
jgi:hypothetical protein